jgi:hypothetical protein
LSAWEADAILRLGCCCCCCPRCKPWTKSRPPLRFAGCGAAGLFAAVVAAAPLVLHKGRGAPSQLLLSSDATTVLFTCQSLSLVISLCVVLVVRIALSRSSAVALLLL